LAIISIFTKIIYLDDNIGAAGRAFCECDLAFVNAVDGLPTLNKNFDTTRCIPYTGPGNGKCCQGANGYYSWFNSMYYQCCSGAVVSTGSC